MKVEFNEDGSIRLPEHMLAQKKEKENKLRTQQCMLIKREMISTRPPKKCQLNIKLSDAIRNNSFVSNIYSFFIENAEVPAKFKQLSEKEFEIEIGTSFRRCSECNKLINRYKEHLDWNLIDEKGSCTFTPRQFTELDYFD